MVRLLLGGFNKQRAYVVSFNPTMVRLLPALQRKKACDQLWFQSHNGAIAALVAT